MPSEEEAVIIVVAGGGSVAVLIGLYKLDALGKLGKYLHTKIFILNVAPENNGYKKDAKLLQNCI